MHPDASGVDAGKAPQNVGPEAGFHLVAGANGFFAHDALAQAAAKLEATQKAIDENTMLQTMQDANAAFTHMMQQVNRIIKLVVTGEEEEDHDGCSGSCEGCGGSCGHHH